VLVEKTTGTRLASAREGADAFDCKRPRKCDGDANTAIALWLDGAMSEEISEKFETVPSYISRLLRLGATRRGTTLDELRSQRKPQPADPARAPGDGPLTKIEVCEGPSPPSKRETSFRCSSYRVRGSCVLAAATYALFPLQSHWRQRSVANYALG